MLAELHIEDLGIIDRVDLVLGPGLTAITGETGAGKTMLVEALELVVGGRAEPTIVRHGADEARVDARFVDGTREVVLTRVVPAGGRSRAYIDGRPATVAALADAARELVDLHGQHAHQQLLSPATQRRALDAFAGVDLAPLRAARARLTELDAELAALGGDERARARELDLARFQVAELDAAAIDDPDEDAALDVEEDTLADAEEHRLAGGAAHELLAGDGGGRDAIAAAAARLRDRAPYRTAAERLEAVLAEVDDIARTVGDAAEGIVADPERLAAVRARRQQLRDLCRKYGDDLGDVQRFHAEVARRVAELEGYEERAAALDSARRAALETERREAAVVGTTRRGAAPQFGAAVTSRLRALAMPHAELSVDIGDDDPGDAVELLLAANPGSPPQPLTRVASGGELARTMLALRLVAVDDTPTDRADASTVVFDEVDAGIGGAAAAAVAEALVAVASGHQVLVVTHLAQVAARADHQVTVSKRVAGGRTHTAARPIDGDARVDELARMLSGAEGGEAARQHAAQLLDAAIPARRPRPR